MPDREKVIKGIEHCIGDDCNGDKWSECEYSGHGCIDALLKDALALLKAQEPRVMTDTELEAIRKAPLILKPNVDAAPVVHGNWIECYERSRHYYCSNCGKVQGIASVVMKYCPECGAKMAEHPWAGRYADQSGAEYADNPTV